MRSPTVDFAHRTPYDEYVGTDVLHALLRPRTDVPEEPAFLVTTQVMELYFGLMRTELRLAVRRLDEDDVVAATAVLRRVTRYLDVLNAAWSALGALTPIQFNAFRESFGEASGFQSAMYRHVEFLLGNKSEPLTRPHRGSPETHRELLEALRTPSLYDAVLALLSRRGHPIPAGTLARDPAEPYAPSPAVEAAWVRVYTEHGPGDDLWELAETLTDVAERFAEWRYRHLMSVRRTMGAKIGSGGSSGASWLERSMTRDVFPELWSARTAM
ncbi:tryptophan 2,3-dioxygenase family protein [Microtetraspora sp. NBRC 16547]|uniref:tryptophan 2,3-dioxygenase n=1 Tax=Microtetraspora sp. NBRC 16547 TaxID=3030993 RepID=UPI0024A4E31F|nr:tryptophan 2,3-dioxygenase family protein [Microtetraspora sp. NBRC 16547]GLW98478.1 tryptophan 2,3-dioxygenase [Microtetraspora sp. NBRC 16547]